MPSNNKRPGEDLEGGAVPVHEAAGRLFDHVGQVGSARKKIASSQRTGQACDRCKVCVNECGNKARWHISDLAARSARSDAMRGLAAARPARRTTPNAKPPTESPAAQHREATPSSLKMRIPR